MRLRCLAATSCRAGGRGSRDRSAPSGGVREHRVEPLGDIAEAEPRAGARRRGRGSPRSSATADRTRRRLQRRPSAASGASAGSAWRGRAPEAGEMRRLHDARVRLAKRGVRGHERRPWKIRTVCSPTGDLDVLAHQPMRHAVAHRVDIDERIVAPRAGSAAAPDAAAAAPATAEGAAARHARSGRAASRASCRGCADRPRHPPRQMRLERGEGLERPARQGIALDVFDAGLHLAFGPRSVRAHTRAAARPSRDRRPGRPGWNLTVPVAAVAPENQGARIVAEQGPRHAAEVLERRGDPLAPVVLALAQKRFDEEPTRVTEHRHEQKHRDRGAADRGPASRRSRSASARPAPSRSAPSRPPRRAAPGGPAPPPAARSARSPTRPCAASSRCTTTALPGGLAAKQRLRRGHARPPTAAARSAAPARPAAHRRRTVPPDRVTRHAQLARNRLRAPPAIRQVANRGDQLAFDHRYLRRRRYQNSLAPAPFAPPPEGVRISVARGSISLSLYTSEASLSEGPEGTAAESGGPVAPKRCDRNGASGDARA